MHRDHHDHDAGPGHGGHAHHDHDHHHHHHDPPRAAAGRGRGRWALLGLLALAGVAAWRSVVVVDQTEAAYVTEFGRPVRLLRAPGLHFKAPHQSARRFDMRLQVDTPPAREMLTRDKKNLEVAWYVGWRIADVDRFLQAVRTPEDAAARLEDMAASTLAAELGGRDLDGLVRVGAASAVQALAEAAKARIAEGAGREYGLEVVDLRLRRLNYPEEVRSAVFEQIRSERQRVAAATRAEGEGQARRVRSAADLERARTVAAADAEAARLVGQGEAEAARIANEAHAADPAFYQFLKTLDTYKSALDGRTTLVLSSDSPFLRLLTQGLPELTTPPRPPASSPGVARREDAPGASSRPVPAPASGGPRP
jgi:membrane protease subunit HflC